MLQCEGSFWVGVFRLPRKYATNYMYLPINAVNGSLVIQCFFADLMVHLYVCTEHINFYTYTIHPRAG